MSHSDQAKGLHGSLGVGELGAGSMDCRRESGDRFGKIMERRFDIIFERLQGRTRGQDGWRGGAPS